MIAKNHHQTTRVKTVVFFALSRLSHPHFSKHKIAEKQIDSDRSVVGLPGTRKRENSFGRAKQTDILENLQWKEDEVHPRFTWRRATLYWATMLFFEIGPTTIIWINCQKSKNI